MRRRAAVDLPDGVEHGFTPRVWHTDHLFPGTAAIKNDIVHAAVETANVYRNRRIQEVLRKMLLDGSFSPAPASCLRRKLAHRVPDCGPIRANEVLASDELDVRVSSSEIETCGSFKNCFRYFVALAVAWSIVRSATGIVPYTGPNRTIPSGSTRKTPLRGVFERRASHMDKQQILWLDLVRWQRDSAGLD